MSPTILILENNDILAQTLLLIAKHNNFDAMVVSTGEAGLHIAEASDPDLIICDYHLDDMTADAFHSLIKSKPLLASIPLILLTGAIITPTQHEQFDACLEKPVEVKTLLSTISSILSTKYQST